MLCLQGLCRTVVLGAGVILLFSSRACYNLAVLFLSQNHKVEAFDYDWYNISDQVGSCTLLVANERYFSHWSVCDGCVFFSKADLQSDLGDRGYIIFGAVLFIWELLPTGLLILIFRVRQPPQEKVFIFYFAHTLLLTLWYSLVNFSLFIFC